MTVTEFNTLSDELLMKRYGEGNTVAFEFLYQRHKGPLFRFILRQVDERSSCEELFQDVWAKVISKRGEYQITAKFTTWLYTIARNKLIDHYRVQGKNKALLLPEDEQHAQSETMATLESECQPELIIESEEAAVKLKQLVYDLPAPQREAFLLKFENGFNHHDIAEITGQKEETIKSQVRYAINKLKIGLFGGNNE